MEQAVQLNIPTHLPPPRLVHELGELPRHRRLGLQRQSFNTPPPHRVTGVLNQAQDGGAAEERQSGRGGGCVLAGLDVARQGDREPQYRRQGGLERGEEGRLPEGRGEEVGVGRAGDRSGIRPERGVAFCTKVPCPPDSLHIQPAKWRTSTMDAVRMVHVVFLEWMSDNDNNGICHNGICRHDRLRCSRTKVSSSDGRR